MITVDLTVRENFDMFRRAWSETAMPPSTPYRQQYNNCFKRFVFRKESDAVIFKLKWAE